MTSNHAACLSACLLFFATSASADLVVYTPSELSDFQVNGVIAGQSGGGIASSTIGDTSVESPNFLTVTNLITAPGQVWYTHDLIDASIDPAVDGFVQSLSFSMELRDPGTAANDTRINLGVRQDDVFYVLPIPFRNPDSTDFVGFTTGPVGSSDFAEFVGIGFPATGSDIDTASNPDFTTAGSPLQFLIVTASGSSGAPSIRTTDFRLTRLEISLSAIPEPTCPMAWAAAAATFGLASRRRMSRLATA